VTIDGELVYSKLAQGRFPEPPEILREVEKRL
jgi:hypothetical protein